MFYGTIDISYGVTYLMIFIETNKTYTKETYRPMLVEGTTAPTEFEPYYSFTKEVLINRPLRKFDYLTYDGVYRQTNEIVLDGTQWITTITSNGTLIFNGLNVYPTTDNYEINYASENIITTSALPLLPAKDLQANNLKGIAINAGSLLIKLDNETTSQWTVETANAYLKQNPITITYKTVDQTFEATALTRLLFKNGYNKITAFDSINNNAIVEYLEYYKSK